MSSKYDIRSRLATLFSALITLPIAVLDSAIARFAVILRGRVRSDYTNVADGILDNNFQKLQNKVLGGTVFMTVTSTVFVIFGATIAAHPRWLRDKPILARSCAVLQMIVAMIAVGSGGYVADHVHGFQTSFTKFGANDSIPYYDVMYYGGAAQAGYGSLLFSVVSLGFLLSRSKTRNNTPEKRDGGHWQRNLLSRLPGYVNG